MSTSRVAHCVSAAVFAFVLSFGLNASVAIAQEPVSDSQQSFELSLSPAGRAVHNNRYLPSKFRFKFFFEESICDQAYNGRYFSLAQRTSVIFRCKLDIVSLEERRNAAAEFLSRDCRAYPSKADMFRPQDMQFLCEGYLKQEFLPTIEAAIQLYALFAEAYEIDARRCVLKVRNASGC